MHNRLTSDYLAGFFDGEGCIDVQVCRDPGSKERLYVRPRVRVCLAESSFLLLRALQARFGGHLVKRTSTKKNQQNSWSLEWLSADTIRDVLRTMLPHLVLKAEQAKLALWWMDNATGRSSQSGFAGMQKAREALVVELRAMKRDPQRLSEQAERLIAGLMRQSEHCSDTVRVGEIATPLTL